MLIHEIQSELLNKIQVDNFKRISGIFLVDKPTGVTSHDVVDDFRRILRTRRVGHAGALDPFASGLLLILVGKYTKYTDVLISQNKSYTAEVLLGIATDTQDPEGKVVQVKNIASTDLPDLAEFTAKAQQAFQPSYQQTVPIFSSVKIDGNKLRVLARTATSFSKNAGGSVTFNLPQGELTLILPRKEVEIRDLQLANLHEYQEIELHGQVYTGGFASVELKVACSKGTYIRQLAEDLGALIDYPACLIQLRRDSIAEFSVTAALSTAQIYEAAVAAGIQTKPLAELALRTQTDPTQHN